MHVVEINKTACVQAFAGAKGEVATQLWRRGEAVAEQEKNNQK